MLTKVKEKLFINHDFWSVLIMFFSWRALLFIFSFIGEKIIKVFGNSFPYTDRILVFTQLPSWIYSYGNFDGVHYLKLAKNGYEAAYTQAFFPLYPFLINVLTKINIFLPRDLSISYPQDVERQYFYNALIISNVAFLFGLFVYHKLISKYFNKKISLISILFLLAFPTSFYFGSIYTESIYFLLLSLTLYLISQKKYLLSGIFAFLTSLTKVYGILVVFAYLLAMFKEKRIEIKKVTGILMGILGLFTYMFYLAGKYHNPFIFLTSQEGFGAGRSAVPIITLPQVFYRYFKMVISVEPVSYPFFVLVLELSFSLLTLFIIIWVGKKMFFMKQKDEKYYYIYFSLAYSILVLLIPSSTGTFSSVPRYSLSLVYLFPLLIESCNKLMLKLILFSSIVLLLSLIHI